MRRYHRTLAWCVVLLAFGASCGSRPPAAAREPAGVALHLEPACDLAAAAGLSWIVDMKPRTIAEIADLIPAIALVFPEKSFQQFSDSHGGIDLRSVKELCVAHYRESTLSIARVPFDPERVATAFEQRSTAKVTRTALAPTPRVVRLEAQVDGERERLVLFGREALALERSERSERSERLEERGGKAGPLRAAEAFAFERLKKASPALRSAALARASEILGDKAPVRVFAPGPFEGEAARGLGGLLGAATAVGASARWAGEGTNIAIRVVLTGAWADDAPAAVSRFGAAAQVLADSSLGHLFGLNRPVAGPTVHAEADALVLDATLDGAALARGIHDSVSADVDEIMR